MEFTNQSMRYTGWHWQPLLVTIWSEFILVPTNCKIKMKCSFKSIQYIYFSLHLHHFFSLWSICIQLLPHDKITGLLSSKVIGAYCSLGTKANRTKPEQVKRIAASPSLCQNKSGTCVRSACAGALTFARSQKAAGLQMQNADEK